MNRYHASNFAPSVGTFDFSYANVRIKLLTAILISGGLPRHWPCLPLLDSSRVNGINTTGDAHSAKQTGNGIVLILAHIPN